MGLGLGLGLGLEQQARLVHAAEQGVGPARKGREEADLVGVGVRARMRVRVRGVVGVMKRLTSARMSCASCTPPAWLGLG